MTAQIKKLTSWELSYDVGVRDACNCMNVKYCVHSLSAITCVANADQFLVS